MRRPPAYMPALIQQHRQFLPSFWGDTGDLIRYTRKEIIAECRGALAAQDGAVTKAASAGPRSGGGQLANQLGEPGSGGPSLAPAGALELPVEKRIVGSRSTGPRVMGPGDVASVNWDS